MEDALKLLVINIPTHYIPPILRVLRNGDIKSEYHYTNSEHEIKQALDNYTQWDLILITEKKEGKEFPALKLVAELSKDIPIIFFTEREEKNVATRVMHEGAQDCISKGNIERFLPVVQRELTHKRLQNNYQKVLQVKEILSNITDLSTEEVYLFNSNTFECYYTNSTAIQNSGYTRKEIYELSAGDIYADYTRESFKELVLPLLKNKKDKISICSYIKRKRGGAYPTETQLKQIERGKDSFILAANKDISGLWCKIQKLKRQRKLTQEYIEKNKRKSDFLANAAHDMRTSLNSIILSNKLLNKESELENESSKFSNAIHHSGNHLLEYINEFFYSANGQQNYKDINLGFIDVPSFGKNLYEVFVPVAREKDIQFEYEIFPIGQNKIKTNAIYLKRILKNILSNAFKYTPQGSVDLRIYSPARDELKKINFNKEQAVAFQVQDTGIGISQSDQKSIFDRHQRSSQAELSKFDGHGLGLDICKQLSNVLGGRLYLKSKVNEGSTFTLYLPADNSLNESDVFTQPENGQQKFSLTKSFNNKTIPDKTILIVDDSKMYNLALKEFLGYTFDNCITATSKNETYQILKRENVDCLILDYILFDTNSIEIARYLKNHQEYSAIPVIINTGKKLNRKEREKLYKYVEAIVPKNVGCYNKLIHAIHTCLKPNPSTNGQFHEDFQFGNGRILNINS